MTSFWGWDFDVQRREMPDGRIVVTYHPLRADTPLEVIQALRESLQEIVASIRWTVRAEMDVGPMPWVFPLPPPVPEPEPDLKPEADALTAPWAQPMTEAEYALLSMRYYEVPSGARWQAIVHRAQPTDDASEWEDAPLVAAVLVRRVRRLQGEVERLQAQLGILQRKGQHDG